MKQPWDQVDSVLENLEMYAKELREMAKTCYQAAEVLRGMREAGQVRFNYDEELRKAREWVKKTLDQEIDK